MSFSFIILLSIFSTALARSCLDERLTALSEEKSSFFYIPECDWESGNWNPLQRDSAGSRWCVDPSTGEVMSEKSELLESCVGCMMSRMVKLLDIKKVEEAGAKVNNVYFPECQDSNSEYYERKQCWNGYFNACWCVDAKSGGALTLPSQNEVHCERDVSVGTEPSWCQVVEYLMGNFYTFYPTVMSNGYNAYKPNITMEIRCEESGNFTKEQCLDDDCWHVEEEQGHVERTRHRSQRSSGLQGQCRKEKTEQLEAFYEFAVRGIILEHLTIPKCNAAGEWDSLQCSNQTVNSDSMCWCVEQRTGKHTTGASRTLRSCDSCRAHVLRADKAQIEDYTTCDETGHYYSTIQCNHDNECWCVDHVAGHVLSGPQLGVTGEDCEILDRQHHDGM